MNPEKENCIDIMSGAIKNVRDDLQYCRNHLDECLGILRKRAAKATVYDLEGLAGCLADANRANERVHEDEVLLSNLISIKKQMLQVEDTDTCRYCINGDCELAFEKCPCSGSIDEQAECAYC